MADCQRPEPQTLARGSHGTVEFAVRANGTREAEEFLRSPECRQFRAGLATRFKAIVDHGDLEGVKPKEPRKNNLINYLRGRMV